MKPPLISIVIPVYNATPHLERCLADIQAQSCRDWECICVDDGSTDASADCVARAAAADPRIRQVTQTNAGPGVARNAGLAAAAGTWFTFVDADDRLHPDLLRHLSTLGEAHQADLVLGRYRRFTKDQDFAFETRELALGVASVQVEAGPLLARLEDWRRYSVNLYGKLYRRAVHGDVRFPAMRGAEDAFVSFDVYGATRIAVFTDVAGYGYRETPDGLAHGRGRYRNYLEGDAATACHGEGILRAAGVDPATRARIIRPYVMRMFFHLKAAMLDSRLPRGEKRACLQLAREGLSQVRGHVRGAYPLVPYVHAISALALRLNSPALLTLVARLKRLGRRAEGASA